MTHPPDFDRDKQISDEYDFSMEYNCSSKHGEILIRGGETLVQLSTSGGVMATMSLPMENKLVASSRDDSGWEVLLMKEGTLTLSKFPHGQDNQVVLEQPELNARTAVWSPCGKYIAVGNFCDSLVSVWHTDTGKLHWKQALQFEIEGEMINPPSLSIIGWSQDGKYITACAEYILSCSIVVCDAETGAIRTIIS